MLFNRSCLRRRRSPLCPLDLISRIYAWSQNDPWIWSSSKSREPKSKSDVPQESASRRRPSDLWAIGSSVSVWFWSGKEKAAALVLI